MYIIIKMSSKVETTSTPQSTEKKTKKVGGGEVTDAEVSANEEQAAATPDASLFHPFSLGDV